MATITILGVLLHKRNEFSQEFQEILSRHGCNIKTRIGIHNASDNVCSPDGIILLDVIGNETEIKALENDIKSLEGTEVQKMKFEENEQT